LELRGKDNKLRMNVEKGADLVKKKGKVVEKTQEFKGNATNRTRE